MSAAHVLAEWFAGQRAELPDVREVDWPLLAADWSGDALVIRQCPRAQNTLGLGIAAGAGLGLGTALSMMATPLVGVPFGVAIVAAATPKLLADDGGPGRLRVHGSEVVVIGQEGVEVRGPAAQVRFRAWPGTWDMWVRAELGGAEADLLRAESKAQAERIVGLLQSVTRLASSGALRGVS